MGSWTKSREKLQFLVNKEMESKVGNNTLDPFSWPFILSLGPVWCKRTSLTINVNIFSSFFLIHGHVPWSPWKDRKNITEFACENWSWSLITFSDPWYLSSSLTTFSDPFLYPFIRWWKISQSLTTPWQSTTSRLDQPSKVTWQFCGKLRFQLRSNKQPELMFCWASSLSSAKRDGVSDANTKFSVVGLNLKFQHK